MANTLRIKRRASGAAGAPTTSQCVNAELAFNEVDGILYYGKGGSDTASSSVVAIGAELGTGVAAFLKTPSSANLATALTDETGSSTVVFSNSPTLVTPNIGTPSAGTLTNCTGLPISGIASLGANVGTFLATPSSANLISAVSDETGSGSLVFGTGPSLQLPIFSTENINASGDTRGSFPITKDVAQVVGSGGAVTLPAVAVGKRVTVINNTASAINVYPASGETVNGIISNGPYSLAALSAMTFYGVTSFGSGIVRWQTQSTNLDAVSGLGTNVATFLQTPNSANLYAALTDETGSTGGSPLVVFNSNPTIQGSVKVTSGGVYYSKLEPSALKVFATSNDALVASFSNAVSGQYIPSSGWLSSQSLLLSSNYGATAAATSALKWQVASNPVVAGESAILATLSCPTVPATYAAHPAGESGYGKISYNLTLPANSGELATTSYVVAAIAASTGTSTSLKQAVAVATTANITLSGLQTIDGYTTVDGDRVLVKNQTTGSANGIYIAVAGSWSRATDADSSGEISGASVFVQNGTANGSKTFTCTTSSITLGTTALTFTDTSTIGVVAGNGLTLTGGTLDIGTASATRIVINNNDIDLASGVVTAGTYRSVTVDTYGRVTGGTTPTTFSDYGISDTSANLAAALSDETGFTTGAKAVFSTSPSFETSVVAGSATFAVFNTTATTVNAFGGATTAINMGATSGGTTTINSPNFTVSHASSGTVNIGTGTTTFLTKTINIGTSGAGSSTTDINIGTASSGTTTINNNLVVSGQLTVNGSTTILNTQTLSVDDKNIELGSVVSSGPFSAVITSLTSTTAAITLTSGSTSGMVVGQVVTGTNIGANATISGISGLTSFSIATTSASTNGATSVSIGGATNVTADGGGLTLKGATDKTLNWVNATSAWTSSEDFNLLTGKVYEINGTEVLSSSTLGSGVTGSSLTSVGTISSGTWQGTAVGAIYGGTGQTSWAAGDLLYASGTNTLSKLAKPSTGTTGYVLTMNGTTGAPAWVDPCTAVANCTLDGGTF